MWSVIRCLNLIYIIGDRIDLVQTLIFNGTTKGPRCDEPRRYESAQGFF